METFHREGDYLVQDSDIRTRYPVSVTLKNKLETLRKDEDLEEGKDFIAVGGVAMLDVPKYFRHEIISELKRELEHQYGKAAMAWNTGELKMDCAQCIGFVETALNTIDKNQR